MDIELTLELCKNTEEYVRAEHYGAAIPYPLYSDCESVTDCGGLAHRPCCWEKDSKCSKHEAWDSYLAHRSADDAVVSRKVFLGDYPYRQWIEAPSAPAVSPPIDSPSIPIFSLDKRWLIDTGSGMDLCGKRLLTRNDANGVPEAIVEGDPITFNTANGPYKAKKQVLIDVSSLGPSWGDIAAAYIMNDTLLFFQSESVSAMKASLSCGYTGRRLASSLPMGPSSRSMCRTTVHTLSRAV